jgi:hypothetical protein
MGLPLVSDSPFDRRGPSVEAMFFRYEEGEVPLFIPVLHCFTTAEVGDTGTGCRDTGVRTCRLAGKERRSTQ